MAETNYEVRFGKAPHQPFRRNIGIKPPLPPEIISSLNSHFDGKQDRPYAVFKTLQLGEDSYTEASVFRTSYGASDKVLDRYAVAMTKTIAALASKIQPDSMFEIEMEPYLSTLQNHLFGQTAAKAELKIVANQ